MRAIIGGLCLRVAQIPRYRAIFVLIKTITQPMTLLLAHVNEINISTMIQPINFPLAHACVRGNYFT